MEEGTAKKKSKKSIEEHLHTVARKFKVHICLVKDEVIIYEMPNPAHTFVAEYLICLIGAWSNYLEVGPELDVTLRPIPGGVPQPRMIIEVERYESTGSLHSLSREYFSNSAQTRLIQVYLSIKIFALQSDGTAAMIMMLYLRNNQIPTTIPTQK
ncbi:hypothetical protein C1645_838104 [Glomus cerebriforme]|uniref:Uncharacterized protein n=1 Tax=Glomus cerebriforme TaxID=658196 RepID=A0A397S8X7_9GLOM|nr:hypothetical protein C1645_838104 [Glomus cerebriforme]